jgi:HPt (histidine-containing phosphotransfer) domain-containing protein
LFDTLRRYYAPARETASQPAAAAVQTEIPVVDGLDSNDGLARVGGNRSLYRKLLRQFLDQEATPQQIADALAAGDWPLAERLAHTCRGVAGNLGARAVQQAAGSLEVGLRERADTTTLAPLLSEFGATLGTLLAGLHAALPPQAPTLAPEAVPAPEVARVAATLRGHLEQFDPAALDFFEAHRDTLRALFPPSEFTAFAQQLASFAFADALEALSQVVASQETPRS